MDYAFLYDLKKLLIYLNQHFREDIGVEDCAKLIGYSSWYTGRSFKKCFGESIGDYLRRLRMNEAKKEFEKGRSVKDVASALSYSSAEGFSRAFIKQFGITPSQFMEGEPLRSQYWKEYDYYITLEQWEKGENLHDGVWEYAYYDTEHQKYELMCWDGNNFVAPFTVAGKSSPGWYCRNRNHGFGIHPGGGFQAVRTFRCPFDGVVDVLFIVGRIAKLKTDCTPVGVQLFHNGAQLVPDTGMFVLKDITPVPCRATCTVKKGDRISLHVDSMGDVECSGLHLYRQWVGYRNITEE